MRAKSTVVIADCAPRLSSLNTPVSATRKVPPFLTVGAALLGAVAEDPPHAATPSPGIARALAAARLFSTARRSISMLARAGGPLSGGLEIAFMGPHSLAGAGGPAGSARKRGATPNMKLAGPCGAK